MVKIIKNTKGSTLALALSMVFLFGALGVGSLEYASGERRSSSIQTANTQAFWLADAGLQQSLASNGVAIASTSFGSGNYVVTSSGTGTVTITSSGSVNNQFPTVTRVLQAIGTLQSIFKDAAFSGSTQTTGMSLNSPLTIDNYNSSGSAVTSGNAQIATNASSISGSTPSGVTLTTNAGIVLPSIKIPSALLTASCPTSGGFWNVTANTTFNGSGNYSCPYLYIASGATLTINTNVVLYLTATDPATGPDGTVDGEDLRGGGNSNNLGYVKILSGGSLTIYAAGRMTFGTNTPDTLNVSSDVDFLNQDPWDSAITYSTGTYVTYNDEAWQSSGNNNTNNTPTTSSKNWNLITWSNKTTYAINNYVTYNGGAWRSTSNNNLNNIPSSSSTYWVLSNNPIPANIIIYSLYNSPVAWNSSTTYATNALVGYGSGAWQSAINNNLNNVPGTGTTYPAWSSTTTYTTGAEVTYNSGTWQSTGNNNLNNTPGSGPGAWSGSTTYSLGAVVTYNGGTWQSQQNNNQNNTPGGFSRFTTWWKSIAPVTVWWTSVAQSSDWLNIAWNSSTNYSLNSLVYYNGLIWQSVSSNNKNQTPTYNSSDWQTYAGVEVDNDGKHFYGVIYAPQSLIFVNQSETLSGAIAGNMVNIQQGSTINYDQSLATNSNLPSNFTVTSWEECVSAGNCN